MATIEPDSVAVVDWGSRDKVGGWLPLKKAITTTLVNFGFEEKSIIFASELRQLGAGECLVELRSRIKPTSLLVRTVGRPVIEIAIQGEPV